MNAAAVAVRFAETEGWGKTVRDGQEDGSRKTKWKGWRRRFDEKVALKMSVCEGKKERVMESAGGGGLERKTIVPFKFTGVEYLI